MGEINERFFQDYEAAKVAYQQAIDLDPERADAWFYMGKRNSIMVCILSYYGCNGFVYFRLFPPAQPNYIAFT